MVEFPFEVVNPLYKYKYNKINERTISIEKHSIILLNLPTTSDHIATPENLHC